MTSLRCLWSAALPVLVLACGVLAQDPVRLPETGVGLGAGVLVATVDGSQAIDTLAAGDRVLTADGEAVTIFEVRRGEVALGVIVELAGCEPLFFARDQRVRTARGWLNACDVERGDRIASGAREVPVARTEWTVSASPRAVFHLVLSQGKTVLVGTARVPVGVEKLCVFDCFPAGTSVATPQGRRAIETLAAGDRVLTAEGAVATVAECVAGRSPAWVEIELGTGELLRVTRGHALRTHCGWVAAQDLAVGDGLQTGADGGGHTAVLAVRTVALATPQRTYDLILADGSSFRVGATGIVARARTR